jgi:hypothetical protein
MLSSLIVQGDKVMTTHHTDDLFPIVDDVPITDGHAARFIDVYIYDEAPEADEPPTVESSCEGEPGVHIENDPDQPEPAQPPRRHITGRLLLVAGLALCLVLAGAVSLLPLVPLLTASASVTIVPDATLVTSTDTIAVVSGTPTAHQLAGRALSSVSMSQAQTTTTTGTAHQDARVAHGYVTFYNGEPSLQVVMAGTLLVGTDGVQVVTDQDAVIPAVIYPTLGQVTVAAHATITGPGGNIAAADIYGPCCRLNVSAVNGAFTGGQNARTYQTVTQQDINTVTSHLKASLDQSVQAALQTQVQHGETLITPLPCRQKVQPDHQPGEEATQVHILLSETCTGEVYTTAALHTVALQQLTQEATQRQGDGYRLVGDIQITVLQTTPKGHGTVVLQVRGTGTWVYQFTPEQLAHLKMIVAGKSKTQATSALLQVPGVQSVSLSIKNGNTLPTDTSHIQIALLAYVL